VRTAYRSSHFLVSLFWINHYAKSEVRGPRFEVRGSSFMINIVVRYTNTMFEYQTTNYELRTTSIPWQTGRKKKQKTKGGRTVADCC
jgi:hypothetical protein